MTFASWASIIKTMVKKNPKRTTHLHLRSPYIIEIQGELNGRWSEWFSAVKITVDRLDDRPPFTTLHCPPMDQAKLRGVINKIWDMNLILVSVNPMLSPDQEGNPVDTDQLFA